MEALKGQTFELKIILILSASVAQRSDTSPVCSSTPFPGSPSEVEPLLLLHHHEPISYHFTPTPPHIPPPLKPLRAY